jgi:hypothetical protein
MNLNFTQIITYRTVVLFCFFMSTIMAADIMGQSGFEVIKYHGQGYSTAITSVTDNGNNSFNVVLSVSQDGCDEPDCHEMQYYSVEALAGTYSNIVINVISGEFSYNGIDYGPYLNGIPFQGFKIYGASEFGAGEGGEFTISYTLTGGLQNQRTLVRAASSQMIVNFSIEDFQSVLNGNDILPYYAPPENGKIFTSLIGAELTSLYNVYTETGFYISDDIFEIVDTNVRIEIIAKENKYYELFNLLITPAYGLTEETGIPGNLLISGLYPISHLLLLNDLPILVNLARPAFPGIPNAGIITSQGDISMRSGIARNAFNLSGEGIKIGVISDSYNTQLGDPASDDILRKDLPGAANPDNPVPVDVLAEYPFGSRSDEGRAMLQIVHDIAPGAELAFWSGFRGPVDFANGIRALKQAGCDIIVDDITYITEPFLKDGIVAQAVDEVASQGVAYFSAAGNFGNKSYQSNFSPSPAPTGLTGFAHNFAAGQGGTDIYQSISLTQGNYTIVLQWDDGTNSLFTNTDMDIYLSTSNGSRLFGFNRINTGGYPVEVLPFTVSADSAETNILIMKASGTSPVFLKYIVFRGDITFNEYANSTTSTLVGQANAAGAMAVGAVLFSNTPAYGVNPPTGASFSSLGGTPVNGTVRMKPDFTAPNGVNTTVDLGGFDIDGDPFPNFFGTSAAAPHAAGVAALLLEAKSKYYNTSLSPDVLRGILQSTALEMNTTGHDIQTGYGFIQADAALLSLASPSPVISLISYDTTIVPGSEPFELTVIGNYLTPESEIYFNGAPLSAGTTMVNDTMLTGIIPIFNDRYPPIQVYNPPLPQTNGTDGGLSNPLYFTTKKTVIISIDNKIKKYGEVQPEFTASYSIEGIDGTSTFEQDSLSASEITRITGISFFTVADALSNVGLWEITASPSDPLNPESGIPPTDSLDIALLDKYNFFIDNGLLSIEKMDLLIIPKDTSFTYGDSIGGFQFYYIFNNDTVYPGNNVIIDPQDSAVILSNLQSSHATALVNSTLLVKATALVNNEGDPLLDATSLGNKSLMIPEATALAFAAAIEDGTLVNAQSMFTATALVNVVSMTGQSALVPATALVNSDALVNSFDQNGNFLKATALVNTGALVNSTALVNTSTINANSNSDAIVILGDDDIQVLSGDSAGYVYMRSINMITGNTVGQHLIVPGSYFSNNFNLSYGLGTLTILPVTATVTADLKVINADAPLPQFTSTFSGFINGENDTVVTGLSYSVSPSYSGSAGTYQIIPAATADNYIFTPVNGTLYVNPYGPSAKHIKFKLTCIDLIVPPDSNGFAYMARFDYDNENSTTVYIPIGTDNYLTGQGSYNGDEQPELFLAGGGTFYVPFDGNKLTWTIKSNNKNGQKTAVASSASSKSKRCMKSEEAAAPEIQTEQVGDLKVYPNPVRDKVFISLPDDSPEKIDVAVFDVYGKTCAVNAIRSSDQLLEIELSGMRSGIYFIKINLQSGMEVLRVIKI